MAQPWLSGTVTGAAPGGPSKAYRLESHGGWARSLLRVWSDRRGWHRAAVQSAVLTQSVRLVIASRRHFSHRCVAHSLAAAAERAFRESCTERRK